MRYASVEFCGSAAVLQTVQYEQAGGATSMVGGSLRRCGGVWPYQRCVVVRVCGWFVWRLLWGWMDCAVSTSVVDLEE